MSNNKLSLHIGEKNYVSIISGFADVSFAASNGALNLNVQRITDIGIDNGAVELTIAGATRTIGRTVPRTKTTGNPTTNIYFDSI